MRQSRVVGKSVARVDGREKVTGAAQYAIDATVPNLAHAAVVRSERAHARITSINRVEVERCPGVLRVITSEDLGGLQPYFGHVALDHPVLAQSRVRYFGEPVALVVADRRAQALAAVDQMRVEYEDLPAILDAIEALEEDAEVIRPERANSANDVGFDADTSGLTGNVCAESEVAWGDIDAAFEAADVLVEGEYRYPMLYGYAMEPYNALATFAEGELAVTTTAQHPFMVRDDLARIFNLPLGRVRVTVPYVGGGYGTKSYTKVEPLAAVASWATGRPVKLQLSVEESILTTRSDSAVVRARSGYRADGALTGREFDIVLDSGAYSDNSPVVCRKAANRCFGPYRIPALRVRVRSVFTNTVPASSLRGFGAPQGSLAGELQMDEAADQLGLDALEIRMRNLLEPGEEILPGKRPLDADLRADLEMLTEALGWPDPGEGRTIGFALSASDAGAFPVSTAIVRIHSDGSVSGVTGASELGQGSRTVLSQIIADEFGLPIEQVNMVTSDTAVTTYERTTGASRTTAIVGRCLQMACSDARAKTRRIAATVCGARPESVADAPGGVLVADQYYSFSDIIKSWFETGGEIIGTGEVRRADDLEQLPPFWEIGVAGVAVSVDRDTGWVSVEKLATVADVGVAVNPALVHGQDAGAAMMGLGAALREELVYEGDMLVNPNVVDYRVPRFSDLPSSMEHILAERADGAGPHGAKGAGEGALNPMGPALAAAIGRAVGRYPHHLPVTPERVWQLGRRDEINGR